MKRLLSVLLPLLLLAGCWDTGSGEKVGVVTRVVADSGVFCKTMEVEIMRGGLNSGTGVVGSAFHVTVTNQKDFEFLSKAMETQQEVKVKYRKEFATWCRSDSPENAFLSSAEPATPVGVSRPAPVAVTGAVTVQQAPSVPAGESRDQKISRLLETQAELIKELATK